MITDPKEQKEFFDIEAENADEFKTKFNEKYVLKDKAAEDPAVKSKVSGGILGSEMTNFYRTAKEAGIEFDAEEKKAILKNEELFATTIKKLQGTYVNQIEELKKTAGQGNDEKIKALLEEKEKLAKNLQEVDSAWKATASDLEKERLNGQSLLKSYKMETLLAKAKEPLKIKQKLTEAEKLGLEAAISQKLKFDLSEKGELETFNSKGEHIVSKQKAGDFLNATDALQDLVNELGLAEINPHGGKQVETKTNMFQKREQPGAEPGKEMLLRGKPVKI